MIFITTKDGSFWKGTKQVIRVRNPPGLQLYLIQWQQGTFRCEQSQHIHKTPR